MEERYAGFIRRPGDDGAPRHPLVSSLTFELTWLCNLACSYCDRHTPMRHEMSREEIFSALDQAYALGMRRTNLDGGEALAHRTSTRSWTDWWSAASR